MFGKYMMGLYLTVDIFRDQAEEYHCSGFNNIVALDEFPQLDMM